ncbi:hypothetical protein FGO68_gene11508 [Halteria grandinella]|uniref:Uncharacterized protein n=1 Tax=Halteria grandinella TaxID=5974 RepID=A0A8J8T5W4_HALGN|nr:hypothetical protein FGO68_gene11508 [Halteria grandinella]
MMRQPGFEPGSTAWKAAILTTRLLTHAYYPNFNIPPQTSLKYLPRHQLQRGVQHNQYAQIFERKSQV